MTSLHFALNHMTAPRLGIDAFFALARRLDLSEVEIRNDLPGRPLLDGTPVGAVADAAERAGVGIATINALQRFNDWTADRAAEAAALIADARAAGARALVLVPVNDVAFAPPREARLAGLARALTALAPMLAEAGLTGLVEPLGFVECSLRLKREAVDAIDAVGGGDVFRLVHDTFHHYVAGESEIFPERTGLVHLSGVDDPAVPVDRMRDPHRVLVTAQDRTGVLAQLRALRAGGYDGLMSFEPFAESVHALADPTAAVAASMDLIRRGMAA